VLLVVGLAAVLAGCAGDSEEIVGGVAAEPTALELTYGTYEPVELTWSPTAELRGGADARMVFVHLVDDEGRLFRTFDHALPESWTPGRGISYPVRLYQSILAPPVEPGDYLLTVGLYDGASRRWTLDPGVGEAVDDGEYALVDVTVPATQGAFPGVVFSAGWSATIAGGDRQVLAVRWLTGEGEIQLTAIPGAGRLWVEFYVPPDEEGDEWVFDGGDDGAADTGGTGGRPPRVRVSTTCSDFTAELEGHGAHDVEIPVDRGADGCSITFAPDFTVSSTDLDRSSLLLQNVSWRGGNP
jgi:hypothetical protein